MDVKREGVQLQELVKFRHATIYLVQTHPDTVVISATSSYIPIESFKEAFIALESVVRDRSVKKLIFDKSQMKVFHQPSMEWYFVEWKEKMAGLGLMHHVKILPDDTVFCQSVKIGRERINEKYPDALFHKLRIEYASSLEEAVYGR